MTILQLFNAILQEFSLPLGGKWFRSNAFNLRVRHGTDSYRREDLFEIPNDVSLNHLCGDVGNENLLLDLQKGVSNGLLIASNRMGMQTL